MELREVEPTEEIMEIVEAANRAFTSWGFGARFILLKPLPVIFEYYEELSPTATMEVWYVDQGPIRNLPGHRTKSIEISNNFDDQRYVITEDQRIWERR